MRTLIYVVIVIVFALGILSTHAPAQCPGGICQPQPSTAWMTAPPQRIMIPQTTWRPMQYRGTQMTVSPRRGPLRRLFFGPSRISSTHFYSPPQQAPQAR